MIGDYLGKSSSSTIYLLFICDDFFFSFFLFFGERMHCYLSCNDVFFLFLFLVRGCMDETGEDFE